MELYINKAFESKSLNDIAEYVYGNDESRQGWFSEDDKSGIDETKVVPFIKSLAKYENIEVVGLMAIAKLTFDEDLLNGYYETMKELQEDVKALNLPYAPCNELSMGMSNDYKVAIKHGATMIRLGRILLS